MNEAGLDKAVDPVCGMKVSRASPHQHEHTGITYFFCSASCKLKYVADPFKYQKAGSLPATNASSVLAGTRYTCPMHTEVNQDGPSKCPKCGMTLVLKSD